MSSMLKKPGLGAFKPKIPTARRRPITTSSSQGPDRSATTERQSKTPAPATTSATAQEPPPPTTRNVIAEQATHADPSRATETQVIEPPLPSGLGKETSVVEPPQETQREPEKGVAGAQKSVQHSDSVSSAAPTTIPIDPLLHPPEAGSIEPKTTPTPTATKNKTIPAAVSKHAESNLRAVAANSALEAPSTSSVTTADDASASKEAPVTSVESVYPDPEALDSSSALQDATQAPTPATSVDGRHVSADTALPSVESASQPATAAKKPRKRKAPATEADGEQRPKKPRKPRAPKAAQPATENSEGGAGGENDEAATKPKRARKRKADTENNEEGSGTEPKKSRRKRSVTPEDAEERVVDPSQMTMGDLTKDLRIGKKFSRHDELRKRISDKRSRARLIKLGRLPPDGQLPNGGSNNGTPVPGANEDGSATPTPSDRKPSDSGVVGADGVQYRMVDGQIVVDTRSLVVDRQARAAAENRNLEEVEENDFTRPTTSATYMKPHKVGPNHWTDEETEQFYEFLRKIGTDFNIIAAMFGGKKTRREVKLKFNREERYCPRRINACIVGKKEWQMDMDEIKSHTGKEYEDSKAIEEELARLAAEHEAEEKRAEEEIAEAARQKREALFGNKNGHRTATDKSTAVISDKAGGEGDDVAVDDQDMAQNLAYTGKAKPKGRGRGKRGYGKATQPTASGFGV